MIDLVEVLGRKKGYYTKEAEKDFNNTYAILNRILKNLTDSERDLLLDLANHNYQELLFLLIEALEKIN